MQITISIVYESNYMSCCHVISNHKHLICFVELEEAANKPLLVLRKCFWSVHHASAERTSQDTEHNSSSIWRIEDHTELAKTIQFNTELQTSTIADVRTGDLQITKQKFCHNVMQANIEHIFMSQKFIRFEFLVWSCFCDICLCVFDWS